MKPLPDTFRHDGFDFRLVKRTEDVAMLEKSKPHHRDPCYEVVIIQKHPEKTFPNGITSPEREAMPPSESWGTYGWSYSDRESAERRWKALIHSDSGELQASEPVNWGHGKPASRTFGINDYMQNHLTL